jgi:hypothetical protein
MRPFRSCLTSPLALAEPFDPEDAEDVWPPSAAGGVPALSLADRASSGEGPCNDGQAAPGASAGRGEEAGGDPWLTPACIRYILRTFARRYAAVSFLPCSVEADLRTILAGSPDIAARRLANFRPRDVLGRVIQLRPGRDLLAMIPLGAGRWNLLRIVGACAADEGALPHRRGQGRGARPGRKRQVQQFDPLGIIEARRQRFGHAGKVMGRRCMPVAVGRPGGVPTDARPAACERDGGYGEEAQPVGVVAWLDALCPIESTDRSDALGPAGANPKSAKGCGAKRRARRSTSPGAADGWASRVRPAIGPQMEADVRRSAAACLLCAEKCGQLQEKEDISEGTTRSELSGFRSRLREICAELRQRQSERAPVGDTRQPHGAGQGDGAEGAEKGPEDNAVGDALKFVGIEAPPLRDTSSADTELSEALPDLLEDVKPSGLGRADGRGSTAGADGGRPGSVGQEGHGSEGVRRGSTLSDPSAGIRIMKPRRFVSRGAGIAIPLSPGMPDLRNLSCLTPRTDGGDASGCRGSEELIPSDAPITYNPARQMALNPGVGEEQFWKWQRFMQPPQREEQK